MCAKGEKDVCRMHVRRRIGGGISTPSVTYVHDVGQIVLLLLLLLL